MKKTLLLTTSLLWLSQSHAQCTNPTSVTATPSIICSGSTSSLNATSVGSSIGWYTVPVGGVSTGTSASGANFSVAPLNTTTYYAESFVLTNTTQVFNYTGAMQTFTVPAGVTSLTFVTKGAEGQKGANTGASLAGKGGVASGVLAVTPGQVYNIFVGGQAGFNGGGNYWGNPGLTCRGGDASDVRFPGTAISDRIIVAGGGGGVSGESAWGNGGNGGGGTPVGGNFVGGQGGGGYNNQTAGNGGTNGGAGVGPGAHNGAGGGGGLLSGGGGGTNNAYATAIAGTGSLGLGGAGNAPNAGCCQAYGCAGGGGGYFGGGGVSGGCCGGGGAGGGSSWTGTLTSASFTAGTQVGNGQVTISYLVLSCTSASRTAVTLTVNPSPTITVNSGSVCSGNSFTISPSGANTYTIEGGNVVVSPTVNTNYTVVGTSTNGCLSQMVTSSVTINASPLPTITVNSGSICSGSSFTINPSGANTYTIEGGNAVVSPTATSAYTVVGTNTAGCVSGTFATSNVTVSALPSVSVSSTGTICAGSSATLTASGANTYSWSNGPTTSSIVVSPTVTTSYTAIGTSSVGCSNSGVFSLVVSPCTGFAEINSPLSGLMVYPNPTNGEFTVDLLNGLEKNITVTDITGKVIYTLKSKNDKVNVNVKDLTSGIYFVKIESNNASHTFKVVKQ